MHIHILGICGTFMGGLALIARSAGHRVTGCDANVYPPMSTQLQEQGIQLIQGFDASQTQLNPDLYIVGNVITRGNPLMEEILNKNLPYTSGPQWLGEQVLQKQHVLAVAGTHGKTTTSSMLAWILEFAGVNPNFLIGGIAQNFGISARFNPRFPYFVIEADEYDTAFFDKRSKFVHYHPRTAILNNLEYDHADIFPDLEAIQRQFHHLVRIIPSQGLVISNPHEQALQAVLAQGCWSEQVFVDDPQGWSAQAQDPAGSHLTVFFQGQEKGTIQWTLTGRHNLLNALAAMAAAHHIGIDPSVSCQALSQFAGIKRRMEVKARIHGITVYDDFAHHPTAIQTTLNGLRQQVGNDRIIAVLEPRSNTMKLGTMAQRLPQALAQADLVYCYGETQGKHALGWSPEEIFKQEAGKVITDHDIDKLVKHVCATAQAADHILVMSNGSFNGFHDKLIAALHDRFGT